MGSLMAGWACNVPDPQVVKYRRNKSLTKEEINAYWRSQKQKEEEHLRDSSVLSPRSPNQANAIFEEGAKTNGTSNSGDILSMDNETNSEKLIKKHGWWVSSSLAHLNEPPVLLEPEVASYKYVSRLKGSQHRCTKH